MRARDGALAFPIRAIRACHTDAISILNFRRVRCVTPFSLIKVPIVRRRLIVVIGPRWADGSLRFRRFNLKSVA